jgi:hypothetical protein
MNIAKYWYLIVPIMAFAWATHGLLFRARWSTFGLPSAFWYTLGIVAGLMTIIIEYLARD